MALFSSVMLAHLPRCIPSCPVLRRTWHKVASGQRRPQHLLRGGTPQSLLRRVHAAAQPPLLALLDGEQVAPIQPDRGAAREPEPPCLLVSSDGVLVLTYQPTQS